MSAIVSNPRLYGAANMVTADGATVGGAVDLTCGLDFTDFGAADTAIYYAEQAETKTITLTGRDGTGTAVSGSAVTPTTAGAVEGSPKTFVELLQGIVNSAGAAGNIAALRATTIATGTASSAANSTATAAAYVVLASATNVTTGMVIRVTNNTPVGANFQLRKIIALSGTTAYVDQDWSTIPSSATTYSISQGMFFEKVPNQIIKIIRPLYACQADVLGGTTRNFYGKGFYVNTNSATDILTAAVTMADPTALGELTISLCSALNDTQTAANRQTLPTNTGGGALQTFSNVAQNCVSSALTHGNAASVAQGFWMRLTLLGGASSVNVAANPALTGSSA